jgi:hypothetical protein
MSSSHGIKIHNWSPVQRKQAVNNALQMMNPGTEMKERWGG